MLGSDRSYFLISYPSFSCSEYLEANSIATSLIQGRVRAAAASSTALEATAAAGGHGGKRRHAAPRSRRAGDGGAAQPVAGGKDVLVITYAHERYKHRTVHAND